MASVLLVLLVGLTSAHGGKVVGTVRWDQSVRASSVRVAFFRLSKDASGAYTLPKRRVLGADTVPGTYPAERPPSDYTVLVSPSGSFECTVAEGVLLSIVDLHSLLVSTGVRGAQLRDYSK